MEGKKVIKSGSVIVMVGGCQPNTSFSKMIREGEFLIEGWINNFVEKSKFNDDSINL